MPDAIITSTASTFGTITGTFAADQSTVTGTVTGIITGTLSGSVGVPGPQGPAGSPGPQGQQGPAGAPGVGVPVGGTTGQFLAKTSDANYATGWTTLSLAGYATESWVTAGFLSKAGNLSGLTNLATARDNLQLGALNTPTFAGVTVQGSGANVANLGATFLTLNHTGFGQFTIQPSTGITFPDTSVQTTAFPAGSDMPTGGLTGQSLVKVSNNNYDADWATIVGIPASGTIGQVLTKNSGTSYDVSWASFIPGDRYVTTSSSTLSVSNGTKSLTIGTGLAYTPNQDVTISLSSDPTLHHMHGPVISYNSGTGALVVDVSNHTGSGTYSSWVVNVGGTVPLETVEWGEITGTLGSQTDLSTALNAKLSTTDAASTYYPLTNPAGYITASALSPYLTTASAASTYQTIAGMSSYLTTAAAASTYYPLSNPSGFINSSDLSGYATESWVSSQGFLTSSALTGYATESWVTSQGYLTDAPSDGNQYARKNGAWDIVSAGSSYITSVSAPLSVTSGDLSIDLSSYLTTSSAAATYLTMVDAASAYLSIYDASVTYYPLSNPAGYITSSALTPYALRSGTTFTGLVTTAASATGSAGFNLPHGSAPSAPVNGDVWSTTSGLFARINGATRQYVDLDGTQTINGGKTFSNANQTFGNSTAGGTINIGTGATVSGSTKTINIGTGGVSGSTTNINLGTTSGGGATITLQNNTTVNANLTTTGTASHISNSTATQTLNLAAGATLSGSTKTVNIGTAGVAGSTTAIAIGSTTGTSTTTLQGTTNGVTVAADTNSTALATTAYVVGQAGSATPLVNGTAAVGTSLRYARQDHVHPTDTSRAALASPAFTGTPTAPTAAVDTNTTQLATTAYVVGQGYLKSATASSTYAPLASPALTGTPTAPTATAGTNTTQIATTAFVQAAVSAGSGAVWGSITGTLSSQTDLQTALNAKLDSTTAASTYQTISGMSSYLTTASAASTYAPLASPALTGTPTSTTAAADTNTTQVATTAFVLGQASSTTPLVNGTAAVGTSLRYARADHVHGTDTTRAPLASPTFTGVPAAPTASAGTSTTQIATTAFVTTADNLKANLASPTFTGTPTAPTAAALTNTTQIATTAFVRADNNVKAWVNFNGTGTVAIRASFNVSSITDNGTGTYTINFTNALADVNYGASLIGTSVGSVGSTASFLVTEDLATASSYGRTTSAFPVRAFTFAGNLIDSFSMNATFFR